MKTEVAIVGGGPAGSATSLYLSQRGISSVIIEEDRFPRFHVGESMTGWAAEGLRDFGFGDDSPNPFLGYERICDRGMDTVQDLIDAFWNNPLGWGYMLHYTNYGGDMLDIFGGMIYEDEPSPGLEALRRINSKALAEAAAG